MKTICFSSIKGGTGKSSLCILTANHAASAGYRVLVADLDLQNSLTHYYLDDPEIVERKNLARALRAGGLAANVIPSNYMGIDILASSFELSRHRNLDERSLRTRLAEEALPYDFLFLDTAPTYDNLVLNALHAADLILTPALFTLFNLKSAYFYDSQLRNDTDNAGAWRILFNSYRPARSSNPEIASNQYEKLFRDKFPTLIAPVTIPHSPYVRRSIDGGEKITESACKATLHAAIQNLAAYCGAERQAGRF